MAIAQGSANFNLNVEVTPEMMALIRQIARDSKQPLEEVFTRAIALYQAALKAKADGMHVGFAPSPEGLEGEFTGLTGPGSESA